MSHIQDMRPGDEGWTVPWAVHRPSGVKWLFADYYLNANYQLHERPHGTVTLRVYRDKRGWHIDDSKFRRGFADGDVSQYHKYWLDGRSVRVRSVTL